MKRLFWKSENVLFSLYNFPGQLWMELSFHGFHFRYLASEIKCLLASVNMLVSFLFPKWKQVGEGSSGELHLWESPARNTCETNLRSSNVMVATETAQKQCDGVINRRSHPLDLKLEQRRVFRSETCFFGPAFLAVRDNVYVSVQFYMSALTAC